VTPYSALGGGVAQETGRRVRETMMRTYEATFILSPSLDDSALDGEFAKIEELVGREGGTIKEWDKWGKRRLAYEIGGQSDGYYAFLRFEADPGAIERLDRVYRLDENILRHMHIARED
jgi:small subunit ribosomal protein S6